MAHMRVLHIANEGFFTNEASRKSKGLGTNHGHVGGLDKYAQPLLSMFPLGSLA